MNLVLDKIIISTWIHWDTYTAVVGTTALPPHPFDGLAVIIFHVCLQMAYVMNRTHYSHESCA
jgi:hypothetical protein